MQHVNKNYLRYLSNFWGPLQNEHPLRNNPDAFLFINIGKTNQFKQLRPHSVNKLLRLRCKKIGISKPVTCYSFKRNGVTHRRLRGDDDKQIQETARWKSGKQLRTYDMAGQEETFKVELIRRGLIPKSKGDGFIDGEYQQNKICPFCNNSNRITDTTCAQCSRLLDREAVIHLEKQRDEEMKKLYKRLEMDEIFIQSLFKKRDTPAFSDEEIGRVIDIERKKL